MKRCAELLASFVVVSSVLLRFSNLRVVLNSSDLQLLVGLQISLYRLLAPAVQVLVG